MLFNLATISDNFSGYQTVVSDNILWTNSSPVSSSTFFIIYPNDLFEYAESSWCEFIYIMKDGVWYVDQMEGAGLEVLADALERITQ